MLKKSFIIITLLIFICIILIGLGCSNSTDPVNNTKPLIPNQPYPAHNSSSVSINYNLIWECSDPDGDILTYDLYFGTNESPELLEQGLINPKYNIDHLDYDNTYYWKVVVSDGHSKSVSPIWRYETGSIPAMHKMVYVQEGTFQMGDRNNTGISIERPVHTVTLSSFEIGKYEVTQAEYESVMNLNPIDYDGDMYPMIWISWYKAVEYCNALSLQEGLIPCYNLDDWSVNYLANGYRLPTEAEWEYAARGGINSIDNYEYSGTNDNLDNYAWYNANSDGVIHETGLLKGNQLGLYDMSGNVWEWVYDWMGFDYYPISPVNNPLGPDDGTFVVIRSSSPVWPENSCRVANRECLYRGNASSHVGFRIARNAL